MKKNKQTNKVRGKRNKKIQRKIFFLYWEARVHVNNSKSPVERGGEGSGDFINVTIKFTWTPYNALHNLVPRSYRVTDWNVILPVKGLVTRLALQYSDDPSPPPSLTFYDLPSTVVVCNYQCWKYMQVIRLIHTTAKFERSRTASLFLLLNDHWPFQVKC